ncbi:MAG: DUF11 domain-containing protein [Xanthomonadaceae bacterium]|nr:DUF11 domain-containing protein [Xanthomonadaceae bacterium]
MTLKNTQAPGTAEVDYREAVTNLVISKTNTPSSGVNDLANDTLLSGDSTKYTIVVTNLGPLPANGAVVTDTPSSGLTCTTVTCAATNGAACPATFSVAALQAGVSIPTLPASNGTVTFEVTCAVN